MCNLTRCNYIFAEREFMNKSTRRMVEKMFEKNINLFRVPGKLEIINIQRKEELLARYQWTKLKYCVHNIIQAKKRMLKKT